MGDPLQIGPVELELLVDEILASEEPVHEDRVSAADFSVTSEDRLAEYIARLDKLELQLAELQHASESSTGSAESSNADHEVLATVEALAGQLASLQSRSVTERDLWATEKADLESLLRARLTEFDALQTEVSKLREELLTVRHEYEDVTAKNDTSERLTAVSHELVVRTEEFEVEQSNWQHERAELQRHLQANLDRLEQFETQLAEQNERQAASERAREAAEARADRLQESVEELSKRLAEQQDEYEAVRATWDAERESLETELSEAKKQLAQSVATESVEVELRDAWERERKHLETQLAESNARLEEAQRTLATQRQEIVDAEESYRNASPEQRDFDSDQRPSSETYGKSVGAASCNPMDRLLAAEESDDGESDEFDARLRSFVMPAAATHERDQPTPAETDYLTDSYQAAADRAVDGAEPTYDDRQPDAFLLDAVEEEQNESDPVLCDRESQDYGEMAYNSNVEEAESSFKSASSEPPVSTADVLARLGQSTNWDEEEAQTDDAESSRFDSIGGQYAQPQFTPVEATPFDSFAGPGSNASNDEEESIEAYMARLMNRVRATDSRDEPEKPGDRNEERGPVTEYTEVKKDPQLQRAPEPQKFNPEEYKPRSHAPEMADRMTAMRSLANDSARSAIASHAKRNWSSVMKLKLLVSVFAFCAVLASVVFFWGNPVLMGLGSFVGLGVLIYWARTAIAYRKLLLASLMLETQDDQDDEPSSNR